LHQKRGRTNNLADPVAFNVAFDTSAACSGFGRRGNGTAGMDTPFGQSQFIASRRLGNDGARESVRHTAQNPGTGEAGGVHSFGVTATAPGATIKRPLTGRRPHNRGSNYAHHQKGFFIRAGADNALGEGAAAERPSPLRRCDRDVPLSKPDGPGFRFR
jgi:hypothetical protein